MYGSTVNGGTGSIFIAGISTESEDSSNINTNKYNNNETVQVSYVIDSDSSIYEVSNYDMEDSDFVVDNE